MKFGNLVEIYIWPHLAVKGLILDFKDQRSGTQLMIKIKAVSLSHFKSKIKTTLSFTSFSWHRPAQREWTRTGLIGPMRGAIPTQSHNPLRLTTPPGSTSPTLFEQWCGFFYVPQEQISKRAVRRDLRFFVLTEKSRKSNHLQMSLQRQHFLLIYLKTLSVGPEGFEPATFPLNRPALF